MLPQFEVPSTVKRKYYARINGQGSSLVSTNVDGEQLVNKCVNLLSRAMHTRSQVEETLSLVQGITVSHDLNIPPVKVDVASPDVKDPMFVETAVITTVRFGYQHMRASDICEKLFSAHTYYSDNQTTFFSIEDNAAVVAQTFLRVLELFDLHWQIHRLQMRYFGRLEYYRKSFINGMADEILSRIDAEFAKPVSVPILVHSPSGVAVESRDVSRGEALKPLSEMTKEKYASIKEDLIDGYERQSYSRAEDYQNGRVAGGVAYAQMFLK